jgi:hypothetical protein
MADYLDYALSPDGTGTFNNVPRATVSVRVVDSGNQETVLLDLTGANAIRWPAEWGALSGAERLELGDLIADYLIRRRMRLAEVE